MRPQWWRTVVLCKLRKEEKTTWELFAQRTTQQRAICLSECTHPVKMNPCSNRCLIAVTSMAVRLSIRFRVEDSLLLCCFSQIDSTSLRLVPRVQKQSEKHIGEFQHVMCFHVGLSLTNQQVNCAQHVYTCNSSSPPWSSLLQNHPRFVCQQR